MLKKVFRYLGLVLGALVCLPFFTTTWKYFVTTNGEAIGDGVKYNLFDEFGKIETLALGDSYKEFWFTLFKILVIVALVVAVVLLVVYLLDDLKVLKLQKIEKVLAGLLVVVGLLMLVNVVIASIANKNVVEVLTVKTVYGITGSLGAWLSSAFAIVGGLLASYGAGKVSKGKKKK